MDAERSGQRLAIMRRHRFAGNTRRLQWATCCGRYKWMFGLMFGLMLGWVGSVGLAAQPAHQPKTALEIERALSAPGSLQPRGTPGPGGALRLRGPAGIVDDPTPPQLPRPMPVVESVENLDYPTLVRDRPRVAAQIHFNANSASIRSDAYSLLDEYVSALQSPALANAMLLIAGHTDAVGSDSQNLLLSNRRARAVRDYLIQRGIAADRLIAKGYGEAYPIAPNATEADRELNRRSEFIRLDIPATDKP